MIADWLDGQYESSGLKASDRSESEKSSDASEEETPKEASNSRSNEKESPEQELRQRRSLLGQFLRRSEVQAFCTEVEELGDSEEAETLISGCLIRVKGWWRKGARFEQRRATVRRSVSSENEVESELLFGRDDGSRRKISLRGVAVESFALEGLFGFRILPLPSSSSSPIDLATETGDQRDLWMAAISIASAHKPQGHVAGVLRVTLVEGGITQDQSMSKRLTLAPNAFFCVVSCNGMCSRTVAKRPQKTVDGPGPGTSLGIIDLGEIFEFPITNDDPDSLIQLQVWSTDFRRGSMRGRVDVPLYALGRKHQREMQLSLRDVDRPKGENSEVGFLRAWCSFEQDLGSLLLPRPHKPPKAAWQTVGIDKGMREQLKELETFMQQFEVFSSRFMHHSDVSRSLSLKYKRIVQWDSPGVTICCLVSLTVLIGFFHEYILPVAALVLLGVILWYHPAREEVPKCEFCEPQEQPQSSRLISGLKAQKNTSEGDDADVKERYENERRLVLGRFTSSRLRLWDPPPWSDSSGRKVDPPKPYEEGVQYSWRVEVNGFTDADGWRYARHFGRGAVWRNTFQHQMFVRRRRHVGRPLNEVKTPKGDAQLPGCIDMDSAKARTSSISPDGNTRKESSSADTKEGKAFEFGLARTPFHDMYHQYLLRLSFLQGQMEYWMDWYERRKNLVLGATLDTQNFALILALVLLFAAWLLPTRVLCLTSIYALFWDGLAVGRLMRGHSNVFLQSLKDTAVAQWLETEDAKIRAQSWSLKTTLDELVDDGVQHLQLRDWIRREYFAGRPMLPLRVIQRCRTLRELAANVTTMSDCFAKRRARTRVWYRSTFRNLLEHVPSDVTRFQPFVAKGL